METLLIIANLKEVGILLRVFLTNTTLHRIRCNKYTTFFNENYHIDYPFLEK